MEHIPKVEPDMHIEIINGVSVRLPMSFLDMKARIRKYTPIFDDVANMNDLTPNSISGFAYKWARDIGDHDIMRPLVTAPHWVYLWIRDIGDKDVMLPLIKGTQYEEMI